MLMITNDASRLFKNPVWAYLTGIFNEVKDNLLDRQVLGYAFELERQGQDGQIPALEVYNYLIKTGGDQNLVNAARLGINRINGKFEQGLYEVQISAEALEVNVLANHPQKLLTAVGGDVATHGAFSSHAMEVLGVLIATKSAHLMPNCYPGRVGLLESTINRVYALL